jgi:CxxC motif-containing protein (DUF1111 family)
LLVLCLVACGDNGDPDELRQGGHQTVDDRTADAFTHPLPSLAEAEIEQHNMGHGPFAFHWVTPQLGPLFNHDGCISCHGGNGRGLSEIGFSVFGSQALVRVSLDAGEPAVPGGNVPVPGYGNQLQDHAAGTLPEVRVALSFIDRTVMYGDGEVVTLREPRVELTKPGGELFPACSKSYRQAPVVFGLGLLEAIPDATLLALADPDDADGDGISGRVNMVWDVFSQAPKIGRFGHKANVATLAEQVAGAFVNDIGLTNNVFPEPDGMADVSRLQLEQTTYFVSTLAVPAAARRDGTASRGRELFDDFGCAGCHIPTLETGSHPIEYLKDQTIHPYTDLLLHNVGDDLSDARRDFLAEGEEWRTPPLWGLGLTMLVAPDATFLHDGRARTVAEAILWHGGEALPAREGFRLAAKRDRDALLAFLATL